MDSKYYNQPNSLNWSGRQSLANLKPQYWHEAIQLKSISNIKNSNFDVAILGYACDEGVKRNLGRVGAVNGPAKFREKLAKLPWHCTNKTIVDVGDVICEDVNMEAAQENFSKAICTLLQNNMKPIAIGGGHDIAYAHYKGIESYLKHQNKRIGIINFDAHFDLRPVEQNANSGTPFYQIYKESKHTGSDFNYMAVGIQKQSNTKQLFDIANDANVNCVLNTACDSLEGLKHVKQQIDDFLLKIDYVYVTIDLDCFSSAYAPGVSAASPIGLSPQFVIKLLTHVFNTKKVISCDIAELNPAVDYNDLTSNFAAKLADHILAII